MLNPLTVEYDECFEVHPLKLYPEEEVYPEETGISVKETLIYLCQIYGYLFSMARFVRLPK